MNKNKYIVIAFSVLSFFLAPNFVFADEAAITNNGSDSNNNIEININRQTDVNQNNQTGITNQSTVTQNSGNNNVQGNLGDTNLETGDNTTDVEINNENINSSSAQAGTCCEGVNQSTIKGNGSGTQNSITNNTTVNQSVNVNNNANVTNNVNINSNTGNNQSKDNLGDVTIKTGNINSQTRINNENINNSWVKIKTSTGKAEAEITKNLTNSINNISFNFINNINVDVFNDADIRNKVDIDATTGGNNVKGNLGEVSLITGDINSNVEIDNKNINKSIVEVDDCDDDKKPEEPGNPVTPPGNGGNNGGNNNGGNGNGNGNGNNAGGNNGQGGQVLAAMSNGGQVLPATGGNWLFLFTLANVLTFLLGAYLRLRAGRSPAPRLAR